jgi:tetratricopeptide (TPR) repeat protein
MLKLNYLLLLSIFLGVSFIGSDQVSFAANMAFNDEIKEAPPVQVGTENDAKTGEVGVSGSYLSSQFSRASGDIESATKSLELVYARNKENIDVANQLMGLYLLGGHIEKAMEIASTVYSKNNKDPISSLMLCLRAIKNNDSIKASNILDKLSDEEGGQLWLPLISAWLDVEQHKLVKPLIMEELSAEVGRAAPIVNYHLGLINAQAGFTKAATENFKHAIEDPARPPQRVMEMLIKFYEKNGSPEVLKPLVIAYANANHSMPKTSVALISNMKDGAAEILLTMGSIMLAADVTQDATLYLQLALYLKPDMELSILTLAQAYTELQQFGIANELLAKIPENSQLYNSAQLYSAINLGHLNKGNEAIAKLDGLIKESPGNLEAYMAKGDLLRVQNRFADAITVYETALATIKEKGPQHWPIYFAIGTSFDKEGNWSQAEKNLRRSLELSPNQPDVLNYLGYSFLMRGENFAEAKSMIEKAIKKRPNDPQIMDSMGWALYLSGDYKESVKYLERAVSLLPADVTVHEHLGDVYWRLGRKTEARFEWDRSLTYAKDSAVTEEIEDKLKNGLPDKDPSETLDKKDKNLSANTVVTQ